MPRGQAGLRDKKKGRPSGPPLGFTGVYLVLHGELRLVNGQIFHAQVEDDDPQGHHGHSDDNLDEGREVAELPVPPVAGEADVEAVQHHPEGRQARGPEKSLLGMRTSLKIKSRAGKATVPKSSRKKKKWGLSQTQTVAPRA